MRSNRRYTWNTRIEDVTYLKTRMYEELKVTRDFSLFLPRYSMRRPRSLVDRIELGPREFFLRSNGQFARFVDARRLRPDVSWCRHRSIGVR